MKIALLFLALIGASCALQYPLTYTYKYSGRIATGIPGLRAQVAGTGIRADLVLNVKTKNQAIAKLSNIEVGEYNGQVGCELREPMPIQYSPISGTGKILEESFGINFLETEGQVMDVPANEEEWVTNIRKSVINLLRVAPIRANFGSEKMDLATQYIHTSGNPTPAFSILEDTIGGTCESQYTLTQLPSPIANMENKEMEEEIKTDVQGITSKSAGGKKTSSVPQIKNQLWRVVRSINYDKCQDHVVFQQSGVGNITRMGFSHFEYTQSRSSVGDFLVRGSPGAFRLEKAVVEGNVMVNPFGFKTERLHTITNQTVQLVSVETSPSQNLRLPTQTRHVKTWKFEVSSPYAPGSHPRSWVNFKNFGTDQVPFLPENVMTGIKFSPNQINNFMTEAEKLLDDAVRELKETTKPPQDMNGPLGTTAGHAALHMYSVTENLKALPYEKIKELFNKVFQESGEQGVLKQNMLVDAIAATGAAPGVKLLLENMRTKITDQRAATIFMTLSNNLVVPSSMKPMMQFVKSLNVETHPYLTSASLVNFATLAHRVCISPHHKNFTVPTPILGKEQCEPAEIINDFLPFLKGKIQSSSKPWERIIYIQALGNLGTPHSIAILQPVILGHLDHNPRVRSIAVYALSSTNLPITARKQVFEILMPVIDNVGEDAELRQAAVAVLLSWNPDAAWWQRMARVSWREPSRQMAAFITSTINSVAYATDPMMHKQTKFALYALPLARPVAPSLRYSYNNFVAKMSHKLKLVTRADLAWLTNTESIFPKEIYVFLKNCFGGFHFTLLEMALAGDGMSEVYYKIMDELQNVPMQEFNPHDPSAQAAQSMMNSMKDHIKPEMKYTHTPDMNVYIRLFENIQHLLPVNSEVINKLFAGEGSIISKLAQNQRFQVNKFFNPMPVTAILPSDIGLPIMTKVAAPTINLAEGNAVVRISGAPSNPTIFDILKANKIDASIEIDYKLVTKLFTVMKAFVPWTTKAISAGVDTEKTITLPIKADIMITKEDKEIRMTTAITPKASTKFPVVYAHTIPFTAILPIMPDVDLVQLRSMKTVFVEEHKQPAFEHRFPLGPKVTGLDTYFEFEGDSVYPFAPGRVYEMIMKPHHLMTLLTSPTSKMWRTQVLLNPSSSETKTIKLMFAYEHTGEGEYTSEETRARAEKHYPRTSEYMVFSRPELSPEDSINERIEKLKRVSTGGITKNLRMAVNFLGSQKRQFEADFSWVKEPAESTKSMAKMHVSLLSGPIPGFFEEPYAVCLNSKIEYPRFSEMESIRSMLQSHLETKILTSVHTGRSCSSEEVAAIEGSMVLSDERRQVLQKELTEKCKFDPYDPTVAFNTAAVYDVANFRIKYKEQVIPKPILNMTYILEDIVRGMTFPYIFYNHININNPEGMIKIDGKRSMATEKWTIWAQKPREIFVMDSIHIPYVVDHLLPIGGLAVSHPNYPYVFLQATYPTKCIVEPSKVKTFDGYTYNYEPSTCFAVAAKDCSQSEGWMLLTRVPSTSSSIPEARLIDTKRNVVVEVIGKEIKVNGRVLPVTNEKHIVKDSSGRFFCEVEKVSGHPEINIPGRLRLVVKEKIEVAVDQRYKGAMCGLCGDFDGEVTNEMKGPKHCVFHDPRLFALSWTFDNGQGCDASELEKKKEPVRKFQEHCPKAPSHNYQPYMTANYVEAEPCKEYAYPLHRMDREGVICVPEQPVPICKPSCIIVTKETEQKDMKCWKVSDSPNVVREAIERGFMTRPVHEPGQFRKVFPVQFATECRRK